ncbi:MAG: DUF2812 domain-containing protein [Dysosmobacter welbionis]
MEPAPVKESCPDPERLAAYQSMGWEYVDTSGKSMHLWRCDDPDAPELHTDPETEAQAYDRLFRRQQKVTQFWAAVTALLAVLAVQTLLTERTLLVWSVQEWKPLWRRPPIGLSAGTRIGGVPAVVVSTTVSAAFAGGSTRVPQAALPAGLRIVPGDHATVGNLHRITLADMADPRSRPFEPAETFDEPVPYITEKGLQEVQAIHWDNWLTTDQWWTLRAWATGRRRTATTASVSPGWRTIW